MKRHILPIIVGAIALTSACGPLVTEPKPDIPETVEYDTVRLEYGEPGDTALAAQLLVGDLSSTAILTKAIVGTTNLIMLAPFILLNEIKKHPPTSSGDGIWVWQHQAEDGAFRMEIFDQGPSVLRGSNRFTFRILGGDTTDELLEVISGSYVLADGRFLGAQRGFGVLHFNFDNQRAIDGKDEVYGQMYIAFRSLGGVRQVHVLTDGVQKQDEQNNGLSTALYKYVQFRRGSGLFEYAARADFLNDGEPLETMAVHSGWNPMGEGRSKSRVSDGSLEINELLTEECWDAENLITFADITPDFPQLNYEDGESSACDANLLEFELEPPELQTPDELSDPPGPHPDEEQEVIVDP